MKNKKGGYVYVLKSINFYKIGCSVSNVHPRIKTHKTSNPHAEVFGIYNVENCHKVEKSLHAIFKHKRHNRTEWFLLSESEVIELEDLLILKQDEFHGY